MRDRLLLDTTARVDHAHAPIDPHRPLAIRSKMANSVWAAHVLQALMAIPAIRRAIEDRDPMDERLIGWRESGYGIGNGHGG